MKEKLSFKELAHRQRYDEGIKRARITYITPFNDVVTPQFLLKKLKKYISGVVVGQTFYPLNHAKGEEFFLRWTCRGYKNEWQKYTPKLLFPRFDLSPSSTLWTFEVKDGKTVEATYDAPIYNAGGLKLKFVWQGKTAQLATFLYKAKEVNILTDNKYQFMIGELFFLNTELQPYSSNNLSSSYQQLKKNGSIFDREFVFLDCITNIIASQ